MRKLKLLGTLLLASMLTVNTFAIDLNINNQVVTCTQEPVMQDGTLLVPLKVISENLGAEVSWDKATKKVTVIKGGKKLVFEIGKKQVDIFKMTGGGKGVDLPQAPQVINGTVMLPLKFVAEQFSCTTTWDSKSQAVHINEITSESPKITTFKNPTVIDDVVYLNEEQMAEAFNAVYFSGGPDSSRVYIYRDDFQTMFFTTNDRNVVNNITYTPSKENNLLCKDNHTFYPAEFYAKHLNSTTTYDEATKTLTVTNNGIKYLPTITKELHKCTGYIQLPDGLPVKDAKVYAQMTDFEGNEYENTTIEVSVDENGYYEFDTDWEYINVWASYRNSDGSWQGNMPLFITKEFPYKPNAKSPFVHVEPSNVEQFPTIILNKQKK